MNFNQIAEVVQNTEMPCTTGTAIAYAESGGDSGVNSELPGEDSRGLFQINAAHGFDFDWNDPQANADKAADIYQKAGGWSPWGAYDNGSYKSYMDEARAACDSTAQSDTGHSEDAEAESSGSYVGKHRKSESASSYTVEQGDTLSQIANDRGTTLRHLMEMNPQIDNPALIMPGDEIDVAGHSLQ